MPMVTAYDIPEKLYTLAEWLELEKRADVRHEFVYGKLIAMPGEAKQATKITKNLMKLLDDPLFEKGYDTFTHDVKAEVVPNGIYRYPDLVVAPIADDSDDYIVKLPVMLAEVASEDSTSRDRVKKRKEYLEIQTLWYYLIVHQDEMWAELHTRRSDGNWFTLYFTEPTDELDFERFGLKIMLADIYRRAKINL